MLKPPLGYETWLDYAIVSMGTRELHLQSINDFGEPGAHWEGVVQGEDMREAATEELEKLRSALQVCKDLVEYQKIYDRNTIGLGMPGNEYYSGLLMDLVKKAKEASNG